MAEFGFSSNVRFPGEDGSPVSKPTAYDSSGNEIIEPKCRICTKEMQVIIGTEAHTWFCWQHGYGVAAHDN